MSAPAGAATSAVELVRARFERLARVECAQRSPLYAEICSAVAGDDETLELMLCAPPGQRRPTLLLAAIHDVLLAGTEHALAAHVPTVAHRAGPRAGRPGDLALDLCREHRDALVQILRTRSTQTNEVNRTAALLPALVHAAPAGRPLRLVELGASAGLNLLADRFSHEYAGGVTNRPRGASEIRHTPRVRCRCAADGELPPLAWPSLAERIGVDLAPVDVADDRAARWLLACTWPDEADRVARLRAAIAIARRDPPPVVRGDALDLLGELVASPAGAHPVIWHSWVLAYWPPARRRALATAIDVLGTRRDLTWLYLEQPSETAGLPFPTVAGVRHGRDDCALVAVAYRRGTRMVQRLADAHPHAHRMRWFAGTLSAPWQRA